MLDIIQIGLLALILLVLIHKQNSAGSPNNGKGSVVVDTSALIDGRIVDVAAAGFIPGKLLVPRFVVAELQLLADGGDAHKRERARFGLDVISRLQTELPDKVDITAKDYKNISTTDDKLVQFASDQGAYLCTVDFNLNKVAVVRGVSVLNLNELAQAVRPVALPGEKQRVKIVQKGSSKDQGVGYLDDGTMVVVSGAGRLIGKTIDVSVTRMLQTEAGKMMFATKLVRSQNNKL